MGKVSLQLAKNCRESPEREFNVVISLKQDSLDLTPQQLGIEAEAIKGIRGILKAKLKGQSVLDVGERIEVEEVTDDFEVTTDELM